jgi:hypothetical protein
MTELLSSQDLFIGAFIIFWLAFLCGVIAAIAYLAALVAGPFRLFMLIMAFVSFIVLTRAGSAAMGDANVAAYRAICQSTVKHLRTDLFNFSSEHDNKIPDANWCDVLKAQFRLGDQAFICKASAAKIGYCSYALNKNLIGRKLSDVPSDTVLLFETKYGWNQYGDGNDIQLTHIDKTDVLFAGGKIRFIKEKDVPHLRWKP